jgi:adenylate cyclase
MSADSTKRKMAAILSADVKGYSRLMSADEEGTVKSLNNCREIISRCVHDHNGRVVDSPGDNVLAEFASTVEAVKCAVKIQENLKTKNAALPESRRMEFRIGVNLGDVIEEEGRIYGDGVNIAARLEGLAEGGGICVSGTAFDQVKNKLSVGYQYLGKQTVKNIPDPVRAYKVLMEPESAGKVIGEEGQKRRTWGWKAAAAVAVLVLVAAGLVWNFYWRGPKIEPASKEKMAFPLPDKPSIAVLPFVNMSGDPQQEYFCDGLTEQIITSLSKIDRLFVIARNSTFVYKGKPLKIQKVAEDLGVQYVLEGSIQRSADRVRITAQLINALAGRHIWAETYDRDLKDIFALQDEITINILTAVQGKLTEGEHALRSKIRETENLKAYEKVLQARELIRRNTKQDNESARQLAEEAIVLDPNFAWAYVSLGWTHYMDVRFGYSESRAKSLQKAFELAQKALARDDSIDTAHSLLGSIYLVKLQFEKAVEEAERAVALNPNGAQGIIVLAGILGHAGRWEESVSYAEKAIRLDPVPDIFKIFILGRAQFMIGHYDESVAAWKKALQKNSDYLPAYAFLAACYSSLGRDAEATAEVKEVLRIDPKFNVESHAKLLPYKNKTDIEREVSALRKAGLPDKPPLPLPDKPSIAVLPFVNMSDDKSQEYFSDGLTEEIITALSKTPKLFVIARNSTFVYKGKPVNVQQVSRELGVKYVLEGSVRRSGNQLRITAQLIDATTGNHLWAERYDRDMEDIFAIQDDVTLKILMAMQIQLTGGEQATLRATRTTNLDAYLKYLQAAEYLGGFNKESNTKARIAAEESIALEQNNPGAYYVLSYVELLDVWLGLSKSPKDSLMRSIELAKRSMTIQDFSGPRRVLATAYLLLRRYDEAVSEARKALEMDPGSANTYMTLGHVLLLSDLPQEAVPLLEKAIRLNPYPPSPYFHNLAAAYLNLDKYHEAIAAAKKALGVNPNDFIAHVVLTVSYSLSNQDNEARSAAEQILRLDPSFSLERYKKTSPNKNQERLERVVQALAKAGLK